MHPFTSPFSLRISCPWHFLHLAFVALRLSYFALSSFMSFLTPFPPDLWGLTLFFLPGKANNLGQMVEIYDARS
jgi:hypothetical protein